MSSFIRLLFVRLCSHFSIRWRSARVCLRENLAYTSITVSGVALFPVITRERAAVNVCTSGMSVFSSFRKSATDRREVLGKVDVTP